MGKICVLFVSFLFAAGGGAADVRMYVWPDVKKSDIRHDVRRPTAQRRLGKLDLFYFVLFQSWTQMHPYYTTVSIYRIDTRQDHTHRHASYTYLCP